MAPHSSTDIDSPTIDRLSLEKKRWVPHAKEDKTALEALSQGMTPAGIPKFPSYHEERTHILEHMAAAFRIFARKGFAEGMAGHISTVYEDFGGVVFDEDEGKRLAEALGPEGKVMTLTNHGLLTVGQTVDEAAYLFSLMEKSCQIQLLAESAAANGIPKRIIHDDVAAYTFKMISSAESLYCEFQPDFEIEDALSNGAFRK
ncbi:hypothetical protein CEP53_013544 [Fusarium sp. AF-6]|nr:hypothetical protein CEP53_013544 [Fusarium sp. AF-6]